MKKLLLLILPLLTCMSVMSQEYRISWDYSNLTFKEFADRSEKEVRLKFLYKDEWIKDLKLYRYAGCSSVNCILDSLFKNTSLFYFADESGNIVITKDFSLREYSENKDYIRSQPVYESMSAVTRDQVSQENILMEIGNRNERYLPGRVTISGYVASSENKSRIAGAAVIVNDLTIGINTGNDGYWSLSLPRGFHEIRVSFMGYKEKRISLNLYGPGQLNIELNKSVIALKEIIVSANKHDMLERQETGVEMINMKMFNLLPTTMGEADLMKGIVLLPGIQSSGEGSAGFNVRGGSADQNLILLHGAPVYNSSHFFGFFSSVNSDAIQNVTLYKGGIPSMYGGRISSVLDIETREGDHNEFRGSAGISPITTRFSAEGPLIKDTLMFLIAARTTYSNWVMNMIDSKLLKNSRASFYDLNAILSYKPGKKDKLEFASYVSHDFFRLHKSNEYGYNNSIVAFNWTHFYNSGLTSRITLNNSHYQYDILNSSIASEAYTLSHMINSTGLRADFNFMVAGHKINFGTDLNRHAVLPGRSQPAGDSSIYQSLLVPREKAYEGALYIEDKHALTSNLTLTAGIRLSAFMLKGPETVLGYTPGLPRSKPNINDTLAFGPGEFPAKYSGPELRASLNYRLSDRNSVRLNYNRTRQYIHLLSNTNSISPTDTWKLCDYYLRPERGDQYAFGFYQVFLKSMFEASAEMYYKETKDMIDFKGGSTLTMIDNIEQYLVDVRAKSYGLELVLKKVEGKMRFNIAYTYSRSLLRSTGKFRDGIINSGRWYPSNYDKPNTLAITWQLLYSRRLSFSADYTYSTGRPVTYPISMYHVNNILLVNYSDRNMYRIPDYSRFDISCKVSGNLKSHKIANPNLIFSVYNLFGKENAYSVYFEKKGNVIKGYKMSVFGRAIPSITFNFDF